MKHTSPDRLLNGELLRRIRDQSPTVSEFISSDCGGDPQVFHLFRKQELIVVENDRVRLNRRHLSPDGLRFVWGIQQFHLDSEQVEIVRWGPAGPPVYAIEP